MKLRKRSNAEVTQTDHNGFSVAVSNVGTITDAFGRTTDHDYDPLGRLKRSLANVGGTGSERAETQFQYDALDHLTAVID